MFGEDDTDRSRGPSPWDPFLASPPSHPESGPLEDKPTRNGIPKLPPEVEEVSGIPSFWHFMGNGTRCTAGCHFMAIHQRKRAGVLPASLIASVCSLLRSASCGRSAVAYFVLLHVSPSELCLCLHTGTETYQQGNVEYKLKLTNITPARFARLVTQLKWRLLEGGGQAYYELGVADTGSLIGLSRADLEESLQTLEMMAGEIGASVIVVKEIEVSPALTALADKLSEYIDPETGEWTEKMSNKRARRQVCDDIDSGSGTPYYTETDENASVTDLTDFDEPVAVLLTPPDMGTTVTVPYPHGLLPSNPERPAGQSSPFIAPLDDDLALFSMEPEPALLDPQKVTVADDSYLEVADDEAALDIEIFSVFKPRPMHQRTHRPVLVAGVRRPKGRDKKPQPWHVQPQQGSKPAPTVTDPAQKALQRRLARDKRREGRRKAQVMTLAETETESVSGPGHDMTVPGQATLTDGGGTLVVARVDETVSVTTDIDDDLTDGLNKLSLAAAATNASPLAEDSAAQLIPLTAGSEVISGIAATDVDPESTDISKGPRIIVEALVVRKMSIDEAFLDFGGFSLTS